jgi:pectinesterase inhibitor-like protein
MDSIQSFKGYGKVDEVEEQAFRKRARRRLIILIVSSIVLLTVIVAAVAGILIHKRNSSSPSSHSVPAPELTPAASLKTLCSVTQYPNSCYSSISSLDTTNTTDPVVLFKLSLRVAINELSNLANDLPAKLIAGTNDTKLKSALTLCQGLFEDAVDRLNDSISAMEVGQGGKLLSSAKINDLETWLSATLTDQETCLDALQELNSTLVDDVRTAMENSTEFASNSLAIVAKILGLLSNFNIPIHRRRLLGFGGEFPDWVSPGDRRLLEDISVTATRATVAKDGSGDYKTISEAVAAVPKKSETRFVIYVKEGNYSENVILDKHKWNVMMYGDGKTKTIVTGNLNFVDGTPTFNTATFGMYALSSSLFFH